jgi:hypothetical protein
MDGTRSSTTTIILKVLAIVNGAVCREAKLSASVGDSLLELDVTDTKNGTYMSVYRVQRERKKRGALSDSQPT